LIAAFGACDGTVGTPDSGGTTDLAAVEAGKLPDGSSPEAATAPDSAPLDAGAPEAAITPDSAAPDMAVSDQLVPDMAIPDQLVPDMMMPDTLAPDLVPTPDAPIPPISCTITYPARASMLTGSAAITIKGQVGGPLSSLDKVTVNGQAVSVNSAGEFSLPLTSQWGLNIITAECLDKAARSIVIAQSFHYSTKYWGINTASPPSMAVDKAAVGRLYQKAIDDSNRSTINDLATILEKVINNTDLDGQIPSTLTSGKINMPWPIPDISYKVVKNGKLTYNPIAVALKARPGGLRLTGKTSYMALPVRMTSPFGQSGTVKIYNLSIVADINVSKSSGGAVSVSVPYIDVTYSSLKVDMGSGLISQLLSAIVNGISSLFKNTITAAFEAEIKKAIPQPVKDFISGFKFSQSFNLPGSLGGKTISIWSALDTIAFDSYGGTLKLDAAVYGSKGIASSKRGSISIGGTYTPASSSSKAMEVGLRYDCLNQTLCAAWYAGALKQDLSKYLLSSLPTGLPFTLTGLKFNVEALLPPILMPGTKGYDFDIGVGDLKVHAELQIPGSPGGTVIAELYASAIAGGKVTITSKNEIVITLGTTPHIIKMELSKLTFQGSGFPSPGLISKGLEDLVIQSLPKLAPSIIQSFPIPAIDLSALGGSYGIPKGTVLKLANTSLTFKSYHLVLAGDLN